MINQFICEPSPYIPESLYFDQSVIPNDFFIYMSMPNRPPVYLLICWLSLSACLPAWLSLSAHIPDCLPTCPTVSVSLPVYLSFFLPVCLPTARLPVNMSTYVFSNCLSLCTCVRLSVLLSSSKRDYPSTSCFPTRHTVCMTRCLSFRQNVQITVCHSVYLPVWFTFRSRE